MIIRNKKGQFIKGVQEYPESSPFKKGHKPHHTENTHLFEGGSKHWNWKGGKPNCGDCGRKLTRRSYSRCIKCSIINRKNDLVNRNKNMTGPNHPHWKGGVTPLHEMIRKLDRYDQWRFSVYKRDGHACTECGCRDRDILEAHHVKEFNIILKEFLDLYNQFSPVEEKEILARLALTYEPFWDISNGKTLCVKCHELTFSFKTSSEKKEK